MFCPSTLMSVINWWRTRACSSISMYTAVCLYTPTHTHNTHTHTHTHTHTQAYKLYIYQSCILPNSTISHTYFTHAAYVSIRQYTSAYVSIRAHTRISHRLISHVYFACIFYMFQSHPIDGVGLVSIRQHRRGIRQHT